MEVKQLIETRNKLDLDLRYLITQKINEFKNTTGLPIDAISVYISKSQTLNGDTMSFVTKVRSIILLD